MCIRSVYLRLVAPNAEASAVVQTDHGDGRLRVASEVRIQRDDEVKQDDGAGVADEELPRSRTGPQ